MKNLSEYLYDKDCENIIVHETCNVIAEDIINEAFKASILSKLAKKIHDWEEDHREEYKKEVERYKNGDYLGKPTNREQTFASIFGPIKKKSRYGTDVKKVRGCKWNEITDDNVTFYEGGYDSKLHKRIKQMWAGKVRALIIATDPDTDDIVYVARGYNDVDEKGKEMKPVVKKFTTSAFNKNTKRIANIDANAYKYSSRPLKAEEFCELINDYNIYFVEIPDSLVTDYNVLVNDRKEAQEGVINYDEKSLEELARNQRAKYKALAKELRAKKLAENPEFLFDEITKVNEEIMELYKKYLSKEDMYDSVYRLGSLLSYVGSMFDDYFRYLRNTANAKQRIEQAKQNGHENPESRGKYYTDMSRENLNDVKDRLDEVKKEIEEIKKELA